MVSFRNQVDLLRDHIAGTTSKNILVNTECFTSIIAILCASWAEKRRVVFPPNLQPQTIDDLVKSRDLLVLGKPENNIEKVDFNLLCEPRSDLVIAEFHTSGSSGHPLMVEKTSRQLFGEARLLTETFRINSEKTLMSGVPVRHLYGFLFSIMIPKISGCRLVEERPLHIGSVVKYVALFDVDIFVSSPAQLRILSGSETFPKFPMIFSSGSALDRETRIKLEGRDREVIEIFGSTETGGIASRSEGTSWWTPLSVVKIKTNDDKMQVCSPFLEDSRTFFLTEDRVEISEGKFRHLGRADDIVKIGGKRVSKRALSKFLLSHPKIEDVAIGVLDEGNGSLHAFVVLKTKDNATMVRQYLLTKFDPTIVPKIHLVDRLPRTGLDKISREELNIMIKNVNVDIEIIGQQLSEQSAEVRVFVPKNCFYFDGHFDDFPILPGVAQLSLIEKQVFEIWKLSSPCRAKILKFKNPIYPDSHLVIALEKKDWEVSFKITHDGIQCSSGTFEYEAEIS